MDLPIRKLWNVFSTLVVAAMVLLCAALVGVRLAGLQTFSVLSGSMEPTYSAGDLLYVREVDYTAIRPGQVITYLLDEDTVATHRVVAVHPDPEDPTVLRFQTRGDANANDDGTLVHYRNVIGTPVFAIPSLGYVAEYIGSPPGLYYAIVMAVLLLLLAFLPDIFDGVEKLLTKKPSPEEALSQALLAENEADSLQRMRSMLETLPDLAQDPEPADLPAMADIQPLIQEPVLSETEDLPDLNQLPGLEDLPPLSEVPEWEHDPATEEFSVLADILGPEDAVKICY